MQKWPRSFLGMIAIRSGPSWIDHFYDLINKSMETQTTLSALSLQYYAVTRKWASDIEFFQFETAFLENLLNDLNNKAGKVFSEEYKIAQINSLKLL